MSVKSSLAGAGRLMEALDSGNTGDLGPVLLNLADGLQETIGDSTVWEPGEVRSFTDFRHPDIELSRAVQNLWCIEFLDRRFKGAHQRNDEHRVVIPCTILRRPRGAFCHDLWISLSTC